MKALEILKHVINAGYLPMCGLMTYDGTATLRDWFGAVRHKGTVTNGTYFYLYAEDYSDEFGTMPLPDALVETEDAGNVWLWLVEE
jgi:hypothetical protein